MKDERIKRKNSLLHFGFGADVMKSITVCTNCRSLESNGKMFCSKCGMRLPPVNLFDYYKTQHKRCPECESILADSMDYCPKCGIRVKKFRIL